MAIDFKVLENALHLEEGTLSNAASTEEVVNIDLSGVKVFKSDDYNTLLDNHSKELENKQTYSNQVGREEILKELKNNLGLEYEGRKDPNKLIEAIKAMKAEEAGIKPDEQLAESLKKVEAYEKAIADKETSLKEWEGKYNGLVEEYTKKESNQFINGSLSKEFEKYSDKAILPKEDIVTLYRAKRGLKKEENNIHLVDSNGEIIKDELRNPLSLADDFGQFMSNYVKKPRGGRGEGDKAEGGKMTLDRWEKSYKQSNPTAGSSEMNRAMSQAIQDKIIEM